MKSKITLINIVQQFPSDKESTTTQQVTIDKSDPEGDWCVIMHNGESLSMSRDNWQELKNLYDKADQELSKKSK